MYIQYLITFGLNISNIKYFYDNNNNKNNKYLYGTNIMCKNIDFFKTKDYTIILCGYLYNNEVKLILDNNNINYYIP